MGIDLEIVLKPLAEIHPYEGNARNNDFTVDSLCRAILEFGFNQPIVIDKHGVIIKGHTRYAAATKLAMASIPCIISQASDEQNQADRIYDNKVSDLSRWDFDSLNAEMRDIGGIMEEILGGTSQDYNVVSVEPNVSEGQVTRAEVDRQAESDTDKEFIEIECSCCGEKWYYDKAQIGRLH